MKEVVKRDGRKAEFDASKILKAISKANKSLSEEKRMSDEAINEVVESVLFDIGEEEHIDIEVIQDSIEKELMDGYGDVAKAFILYREQRAKERFKKLEITKSIKEKLDAAKIVNSNANMDEASFGGRKGEASNELIKEMALDFYMNSKMSKNHRDNRIYIHDLDSYAIGQHNCLSCPVDDLLENGFNTRQTDIRPASSINTAFQLLAVIFQIQSLQQFGGVSATHIDWTMVPYIRLSFYKHYKEVAEILKIKIEELDKETIKKTSIENFKPKSFFNFKKKRLFNNALKLTVKELNQSIEGMYHNLNTLQSRSGNQLPFSSLNYGTCTLEEGRMVIKSLLEGSLKGTGKFGRLAIFPCGIFQKMKGVNDKGSPNYDLYQLAIKSTVRRFYPNYANCDWNNQTAWVEYDRNIKQEVLNELTDEERNKLISLIKENPEIGKKLSLKIEE